MKLTELKIAPDRSWSPVGQDNPLKAVVKIEDERSAVEVVLSEDTMHKLLDLCAHEIAASAKARMDEFCAHVTAVQSQKGAALIEGASQ